MSEFLLNRDYLFKWDDIKQIIDLDRTLKCTLDIFKSCTAEINKNGTEIVQDTVDKWIFMADSVVERQWEVLNTGAWSCVEQNEKQVYGLAIYFKVTLALLKPSHTSIELQNLLSDLDHAIIKGAYLSFKESNILRLIAEHLNLQLYHKMDKPKIKSLDILINENLIPEPRYCQYKLDILETPPSIEKFMRRYFNPQKPCIIQNYITQNWEACEKWKNVDYLMKVCGHRLIPVEIGSSYADENWKQKLILFKDFLSEIVSDKPGDGEHSNEIKYLAQHNLFEQITELQNDFTIPEYCYVTNCDDIDIKSWFGPKNTKTPLHYDNKQNLLCQVFGYKRVILISPADSKFIDCYDSLLLNNTCTIDFDDHNYSELNPSLANCKICEFILKPGDMLFIPYKWWHYVKSLSTSFSVSFWWE